jgi:hypothetical protein
VRTVLRAALAVVTGALLVTGTATALRLGQDGVLPVAGVAAPDAPPTWPVPVLPTDIADDPVDRPEPTAEPVRERTRAPEPTRARSRPTTPPPPPPTTAPVPTAELTTTTTVPEDGGGEGDPDGDGGAPTTGDGGDPEAGAGPDVDGPPIDGVVRRPCELLAC